MSFILFHVLPQSGKVALSLTVIIARYFTYSIYAMVLKLLKNYT